MFARHVTCAATVVKTTYHPRRAVIQRGAIGRLFGQSLLDIASDDLGERQATLASLGPQSSRLLVGQLNLCSNHPDSVSTS